MENSRHIIDMVKNYDFIYGTVGAVHPSDIKNLTVNDRKELKQMDVEDKMFILIATNHIFNGKHIIQGKL